MILRIVILFIIDIMPADCSTEVPAWAATSLAVMAANGMELEASEAMTRGEIANILYQTSRMAVGAPGMMVFNLLE